VSDPSLPGREARDVEPRVLSVNVGVVREILWRNRVVRTGIWKYPVGDRAIRLRGVNLVGDDQADRTVHGGPDKAVYAYAVEDYRYWADHEGIATSPGLFGENLTVRGLDLRTALIGEWWGIGTALLQVAQPRLPCFKLGVRLADPRFPKRFLAVGRFGAYLRILEEGEIRAGDAVRVLRHADCRVSLQAMAETLIHPTGSVSVQGADERGGGDSTSESGQY